MITLRCQVNMSGLYDNSRKIRNFEGDIFFFSKATNENAEVEGNSEDSVVDDTTEDYWAGSGSGPDEDESSSHNETREALTHEASDHDTVSHASPICFALRTYLLKFMIDIAQEVSPRSAISFFRYVYENIYLFFDTALIEENSIHLSETDKEN